jgi:hypothetical protein
MRKEWRIKPVYKGYGKITVATQLKYDLVDYYLSL